jgi:hypothetical protein
MYRSRSKTEREISRPTPLKIATETNPSKLEAVFSDDRSKCLAITVFMSRSVSATHADD